jgi:hypothetical protein
MSQKLISTMLSGKVVYSDSAVVGKNGVSTSLTLKFIVFFN